MIYRIMFQCSLVLVLSGCMTFPQIDDHVVYRDRNNDALEVPNTDVPSGKLDPDLSRFHEYAILSANIYEGEFDNINKTDCVDDGKRFVMENWNHVSFDKLPKIPDAPSYYLSVGTLGYEVWVNDVSKIAAIVYRGTDFNEYEDWFANFRWITRVLPFTWDQYEQAEALTPLLVNYIKDNYGEDFQIISTGHSLGGGLAQQAGYGDARVDQVFAFDSSVVTGFYSIPYDTRKQSVQGLKIYRVYEHGEVLAYLRLGMKSIFPISVDNPDIIEVRYDLEKSKNPISQHNMKVLACKLNDIASSPEKYSAAVN